MVGKVTIEDMQRIAAGHGGRCLSAAYLGREVPLRWLCAEGQSDYEFLSQLWSEWGIYYHFDGMTLVLCDSPGSHK
ncbi:contractile injection system protein, VgrG/Pvc8 family, partial [Caballeronia sp. GaOx3]|uniref:contractile injection system protein, VgrG/Pvc8 family n=1 Tax=Caballeronia sp. GaOx3 TaxID=2921740 RepID=UPI0020283921